MSQPLRLFTNHLKRYNLSESRITQPIGVEINGSSYNKLSDAVRLDKALARCHAKRLSQAFRDSSKGLND